MPKRVLVVSARMGAGHDGAAKELCTRLEKRGHQTKMVDFLDASPKVGNFLKNTYELQLERAPWSYDLLYRIWTWTSIFTPPVVFILAIFFERQLRRWAEEFQADLIVTTYPFASVVLGRARIKRRNRLQIPVSTFLTDFAVHPLWVHRGVDSHICVHPRAAQAVYNLTGELASSPGPLVSSAFYQPSESKAATRSRLNVPFDKTAVLIVAGSWGVGELEDTFDALSDIDDFFPVAVCGRNTELASRLRARRRGLVLTWTEEMPAYMRACDVVVQNAGGLTCMEAFASELPVISYNPIPGHGRQNVFEMTAAGMTKWARNKENLERTIREATNINSDLSKQAKTVFIGDAADDIEGLLYGEIRPRIAQSRPTKRRFVGAIAALVMFFISINVISNISTSKGLNVSNASYAAGKYIFVSVVLGNSNINVPRIDQSLAQNNIAAIVTGRETTTNPSAINKLANNGIDVVNGGWDTSSDLHLLTPDNAVAHTMSLIRHATHEQIDIYAPQTGVNSVDLAWASLHHITIIRPFTIKPKQLVPNLASQLKTGQIYELDGTKLTADQLQSEIESLKTILNNSHYNISPLWIIR